MTVDANFTKAIKVTIDKTKVPSTLTNFPIYINLADLGAGHSFWSNVKSDGSDIRVTESDGKTECPIELVAIDTTAKTGEFYFKASSLSSAANTSFYIFYGYASATAYADTDTFGARNVWNSNYAAVFHLQQDPSGSAPQMKNSKTGNNGTSAGSMTSGDLVTAKIGKGLDLDGSNDRITFSDSGLSDNNVSRSISFWAKPTTSQNAYAGMVSYGTASQYDAWSIIFDNTTKNLRVATNGGNSSSASSGALSNDVWSKVNVTYDGTTVRFYINGSASGTSTFGFTPTTILNSGYIGSSPWGDYFTGVIDEVRLLAGIQVSADWITAEYNNENSPSTFYTLGAQINNPQFVNTSNNWSYYVDMTVDKTKLSADVEDFPVIFDLANIGSGHGFWTHVKTNGADIRAAIPDGIELPVEIVKIDTTAKTGHIAVKGDFMTTAVNKVIRLYYGYASATAYASTDPFGRNAVWSNGFKGVWHLDEASGNAIDSSGNGGDMTVTGATQNATGKLGKGVDFTPNQYLTTTDSDLAMANNFTMEALIKGDSFNNGGSSAGIMSWGENTGGKRRFITADGANFSPARLRYSAAGGGDFGNGTTSLSTGTWYHVVCTMDGSNNGALYVNNTANGTGTPTHSSWSTFTAKIGTNPGNAEGFDGIIDEVRVSSGVRSSGWIKATYENLMNNSTFFSVGTEIPLADVTAPTLSSSTPTDGATGVARNSNIVLNFDETVQKGTGNFVIKKYSDDTTIETIDVTSGAVSVSGSQVTINPTSDLPNFTRVYLTAASGVIKDNATSPNNWAGIASKDTLDFTTVDDVAPTLSSSTPTDGATGVARNSNIVLNFDETVQKGTGNFVIKKYSDDTTIETIDVTSGAVSVSGSQVTINPTSDLPNFTRVYLTAASGVIKDNATSPNNWAGIASKDTLDFTTVDDVAPVPQSFSPADNATAVALLPTFQIVFDEAVTMDAGTIKLYKTTGAVLIETFGTAGTIINGGGSTTLTFTSTVELDEEENYYLTVDGSFIKDASNNYYAGIATSTAWNFTTKDTTSPTLESTTPTDNATSVDKTADLVMNFDEDVFPGVGKIKIRKLDHLFIGKDPVATQYAATKIGEILIFRRKLTDAERQKVEGYLAWKYGSVANLPSSHPYKNDRPYVD